MKIKHIIIIALFLIPKISLAERITSFDSQMVINQDRSIDVTETITYDSEGLEKQGIYRKLALDRKFISNIKVFRDGRTPELLQVSRNVLDNTLNIRIGQEGSYFTGIRQYTIQYKYNNIIQPNKNLDILQHSITGNNWEFPIYKITATIILPQTIQANEIKQLQCYIINNDNISENQCKINQVNVNTIELSSNRPIFMKEGLEFLIGINLGIFNQPSLLSRPNVDMFIASAILILGLISIIIIWLIWYKNKNIKYESVVQYTPPQNLSPAGVGYFRYGKSKPEQISALMISLAKQGIIKIKQNFDKKFWQKSKYTFDMIDKEKAKEVKFMGEAFLIESLFKYYLMTNNRLFLEIKAIISKSENRKSTNTIIISFIFMFLIFYIVKIDLILILIVAGVIYLIISRESKFREIYQAIYLEEVAPYYIKLPNLIRTIFWIIPLTCLFLAIFSYTSGYSLIAIALFIVSILIHILSQMPPKRSQAGDEMMAYILGFEEYIVVAEKHRLDFQGKNYLFFEILPYAIALGHTKVWTKAFEGISEITPDWFVGTYKYNHNFSSYWFYNDIFSSTEYSITKITNLVYDYDTDNVGFFGTGFGGGFGRGGGGGSW